MSVHKNNGFSRTPLGQLGATEKEKEGYRFPEKEVLTDTTEERKKLLEDFKSGLITNTELRVELQLLKEKQNE